MEKQNLEKGMVVQLSPETENPMFAGCFMIITEPKSWGAQGYVQSLGENGKPGGLAYYRENFENMEFIGHAVWVTGE